MINTGIIILDAVNGTIVHALQVIDGILMHANVYTNAHNVVLIRVMIIRHAGVYLLIVREIALQVRIGRQEKGAA